MLCYGPAPRRDDVFEHLRAEDFYVPAHRMIFGAMRRLYDDNQPIDTVTVVDRLHRGPVAFFSMEMSPTEIAYRWLGSQARVDSMKLRSGLGEGNSSRTWAALVDTTARLYKVPLHADEGPRTVTDIRAKCRGFEASDPRLEAPRRLAPRNRKRMV